MAELEQALPQEAESQEELVLTDEDKAALLSLFRSCMKEEQYSRRNEVRWARMQRYYERGDQNIGWDERAYTFIPLAEYAREKGFKLSKYTQVYNIYAPRLRSITSILTQVTPGINFKPKSLKKSTDISAAQFAEKMRSRLYQEVNWKSVQGEIARLFCTDSRVVLWMRNENGVQRLTAHAVLETKVPIHMKSVESWGYAVISEEIDMYAAKDAYPDDAEKINNENASSEGSYERLARIGVLGGTKSLVGDDGNKHLVTRHDAWIMPSRYRKLPDEVQPKIKQMFANGLHMTICGDVVCDVVNESFHDCLSVSFPKKGDGANRPSLLKDFVAVQDAANDVMNLRREAVDYGIPGTWFDSDSVDEEAIADQQSSPGGMFPIKVGNNKSVADLVMQENPAVVPPDASALTDLMFGPLGDAISGDLPSLHGSDIEGQDTVGVYSMSRDQAMGGLTTAWAALQYLAANATYQGVIQMATALGDSEVSVEDDSGGADSFAASEVLAGQFGAYPDQDSSFPETTASKRAAVQAFLTSLSGTELGTAIENSPDNAEAIIEIAGLSDVLTVPQAESRNKQLQEIEQLLAEQPMPGNPPTLNPDGTPVLEASVPIDAEYDNHDWEYAKVMQWMSSPAKRQQVIKGNQLGVENVRLHGNAHKAIIDQRAQAAAAAANQQKPPSVSIAYKDVGDPNAQAQLLAEVGVKADPDTLQEEAGAKAAQDALPHVLHAEAAQSTAAAKAQQPKRAIQ